jgi:hypothetical protein
MNARESNALLRWDSLIFLWRVRVKLEDHKVTDCGAGGFIGGHPKSLLSSRIEAVRASSEVVTIDRMADVTKNFVGVTLTPKLQFRCAQRRNRLLTPYNWMEDQVTVAATV